MTMMVMMVVVMTMMVMMVVVMTMMVMATMSKYTLRHTCSCKQQDCRGRNSNYTKRFIHFVVIID
jgi:preprotein translocase subunit Sec63